MTENRTEALANLQADAMVLYQKIRNFHWTVRGPMFFELHTKFEELYTEAALQVDELAERILAVGGAPVPTNAEALRRASLVEETGQLDGKGMVGALLADYEALVASLRKAGKLAEDANDAGTLNLLDGIADGHEKTAWMLRAYLG